MTRNNIKAKAPELGSEIDRLEFHMHDGGKLVLGIFLFTMRK